VLLNKPVIQLRDWSFFIRYEIGIPGDQQKAIFVKIRRHPDKSIPESINDPGLKEEGLNDFRALQSIEGFIRNKEPAVNEAAPDAQGIFQSTEINYYCAVRPLAFFDEWSALVMEQLEAVPLRKKFLDFRTAYNQAWQDQLATFCYRSGRWLRVYHEQLGQLHAGPFFSDNIHNIIERNLQFIQTSSHFDLTSLRKTLDQTRVKSKYLTLPHGLLHWNFDCANILISTDNRVGVLDSHFIEGPIYVDITKIMTDLQTYSLQTLSYGWFIRAGMINHLHQSILRGYFGEEPYSKTALTLYSIFSVLEKWQSDEETLQQTGKDRDITLLALRTSAAWRKNYFWKLINSSSQLLQNLTGLDKFA
jgi:hypothetical protein